MKRKILLLLVLTQLGCSKGSDSDLFGSKMPVKGISKELPEVPVEAGIQSQSLSVEFQKHLDKVLDTELVQANTLQLYQNGESYRPLLKMIENSKKYFYMNLLSFTCDDVAEEMVQSLEKKAGAGVDVRLIVNKGFSYVSLSCLSRLEKAGVKIVKNKTHSSYFINDQQELMIGSQSVARMFFLADGFNSLDRDMMLYAQGALATDAFKDFISIWVQDGKEISLEESQKDLSLYQQLLKADYENKLRGESLYKNKNVKAEKSCRFVAERPSSGLKDIQTLWIELVKNNQKELFFSGVKVETGEGELGKLIKKKSLAGMQTHYMGNGYSSGNGELTMVIEEWLASLKKSSFSFLAPVLEGINLWDKKRLVLNNQKLYDSLKDQGNINVWGYFNFIHYKTWLLDNPGFFVGSANLDESKFGIVYEAGVYCLDEKIHKELKSQLMRDQRNSSLYGEARK